MVFVVCLAVGAAGFLAYRAWEGAATYYLTVSELKAQESSIYDKRVKVAGKVVPGSIDKDNGSLLYSFNITEGGETFPVIFNGIPPDAFFRDDVDVVVEGSLNSSGVFQADTILTQCESKYVPEGVD